MTEHEPHDEIGAAIRAATAAVKAPQTVHAGIQRRRARRSRSRRVTAAAVAMVVAVLAGLAVIGNGPTVGDVAVAALSPPTRPAPAVAAGDPRFIDVAVDGLAFPNYDERWGWKAVGARTDEVGGRRAVTVIYRRGSRGVHYTMVEGAPLPVPDDARVVRSPDGRFAVTRGAGADVVSWERRGHTCVLASDSVDAAALLRMATW